MTWNWSQLYDRQDLVGPELGSLEAWQLEEKVSNHLSCPASRLLLAGISTHSFQQKAIVPAA
jgi:hypothetical protein